MSRVFDGLKRTTGEVADLTAEVIGRGVPLPLGNNAPRPAVGPPTKGVRAAGTGSSTEPSPPAEASQGREAIPNPHSKESIYESVEAAHAKPHQLDGSRLQGNKPSAREGSTHRPSPITAPTGGRSKSAVIRLKAGSPLFPFDTGDAETAAEEYRRIRTRILQHDTRPQLMLVSSPTPGDGKSVTAINIGGALALNPDARVLLVDVDLRCPTLAGLLGVSEEEGVAEILAGSSTLDDLVLQLQPFPNLFLLPAGRDRKNPTELLSSPRWKSLCGALRAHATYTILDGPPVDAVAEYSLLQEHSDGLILVVRNDHTDRSLLNSALESIPKNKLIGGVINSYKPSTFWKPRRSGYGYYAY